MIPEPGEDPSVVGDGGEFRPPGGCGGWVGGHGWLLGGGRRDLWRRVLICEKTQEGDGGIEEADQNCQVPGCEAEVLWAEAEFHHVQEHSKGGPTSLENGALVQKGCHPKSAKEVAKFAEHWEKRTRVVGASAEQQIPSDIASLMKLGNLTYEQAVAMKAQLGKQKD